jgi:hypothetical protein
VSPKNSMIDADRKSGKEEEPGGLRHRAL